MRAAVKWASVRPKTARVLSRGSRELFPFLERAVPVAQSPLDATSSLAPLPAHAAAGCSICRCSKTENRWRPDRESNPGARICSPLRHHSAIGPRCGRRKCFVLSARSTTTCSWTRIILIRRGWARCSGQSHDPPRQDPTDRIAPVRKRPSSHFGRRRRHSLLGIVAEVVPWSSACALDVPPATSSVSHGRAGRLHRKIVRSPTRRAQLRLGAIVGARYTSARQLVYCATKTVVRQDGL